MPVMVFGPSDDIASLIGMILLLTLLNDPWNTSRNHCRQNTIRRAMCRCQLKPYLAKIKPHVNMVQKRRSVLWAKAPACYQRSVQQPASLMVWGCISAYGMGSLHVLEGTMNAERYINVLEQLMLPPDDVYCSRTIQNHILQLLQQHGFV